jgi:hypothetical protein
LAKSFGSGGTVGQFRIHASIGHPTRVFHLFATREKQTAANGQHQQTIAQIAD